MGFIEGGGGVHDVSIPAVIGSNYETFPANIYLFKVKNIETLKKVVIFNFKHISLLFIVFPLLTLIR